VKYDRYFASFFIKRRTFLEGNHIHIGAGNLGLGLVIPMIRQSGLSTTLLTRFNAGKKEIHDALKKQSEYVIKEYDTEKESKINKINFIYFDKEEESAIKDISREDTVLLTTAVTSGGLPNVAPIIAKGIETRIKSNICSHLFVVACENLEQNSGKLKIEVEKYLLDEKILEGYREKVSFLNTVVDKICVKTEVVNSKVVSHIESWAEWKIDVSNANCQPTFLKSPIEIIKEKKIFDFYKTRKAWLINGTHFAISILGYLSPLLLGNNPKEIAKNLDVQKKIMSIQGGFVTALNHFATTLGLKERELPDIAETNLTKYAIKTLERIEKGPDDNIERILKDLLQIHKLKDVLGKINENRSSDSNENIVKNSLRLANLHPFFMKSYDRICAPISHILLHDEEKNGMYFSRNPEHIRAILEYMVAVYSLIDKELEAYSKYIDG
jgi:mannitol-1-phosphate 5-dehydrogenase